MIDAYERKHENRVTITDKIAKLSGDEPWAGYDEQSADAIATVLRDADADQAAVVRSYERDHKPDRACWRPPTSAAPRGSPSRHSPRTAANGRPKR